MSVWIWSSLVSLVLFECPDIFVVSCKFLYSVCSRCFGKRQVLESPSVSQKKTVWRKKNHDKFHSLFFSFAIALSHCFWIIGTIKLQKRQWKCVNSLLYIHHILKWDVTLSLTSREWTHVVKLSYSFLNYHNPWSFSSVTFVDSRHPVVPVVSTNATLVSAIHGHMTYIFKMPSFW